MVLVFGVFMAGCMSVPPNYYNLGNVSEENCALIEVSSVNSQGSDYPAYISVTIDGQGSQSQWKYPHSLLGGDGKAIVRVTPGNHTFTLNFIYKEKAVPVSITYNCKAGKGYSFSFSAKGSNPISTEITIFESTVDQNGNFGGWGSDQRVADKKTESFSL
jgi:hypothetical protein